MPIALPILLQQIGRTSWLLILMVVVNFAFHNAELSIPDLDLMEFVYLAILTYGYVILFGIILYLIMAFAYSIIRSPIFREMYEVDLFRLSTMSLRIFSTLATGSILIGAVIVFWTYDSVMIVKYGKWGVLILLLGGIIESGLDMRNQTVILEGMGDDARQATKFSITRSKTYYISGESREKAIQWLISSGWKILDTNYEIVDREIRKWIITFNRE